tara:strand:+ start:516 stop:758 length:243 start_codon:yes stop_codon:yes gene_type:complete
MSKIGDAVIFAEQLSSEYQFGKISIEEYRHTLEEYLDVSIIDPIAFFCGEADRINQTQIKTTSISYHTGWLERDRLEKTK